ncbi:Reverse transcriptase domain-containing protein [Abeliophyllum distichum]|uniref:Reverse transcriptase domain-containing protein n=1 Tax=Abeliophyllum distichum TaxID=126358 RepID=A0ABD1SYH4_9LAMI
MNSRRNYTKAAREEPVESWQVHGHRPKAPLFSFTKEDEAGVHYPQCNALFHKGQSYPMRKDHLAVDFDEPLHHLRKFMKFMIVDTRSAYHGVLGRPALKDLQAITSIHHLAMKFPTPEGVSRVRRNQTEGKGMLYECLAKGDEV